MNNFLLFK